MKLKLKFSNGNPRYCVLGLYPDESKDGYKSYTVKPMRSLADEERIESGKYGTYVTSFPTEDEAWDYIDSISKD